MIDTFDSAKLSPLEWCKQMPVSINPEAYCGF